MFFKNETNIWIYYHFTHVYHKWQSYDVWFLRHRARQIKFFVILDNFYALLPLNNPKNQNFEKLKKIPGGIIILHKCTKNHDHMLHYSWDMMHDWCNSYFLFWAIFRPFTPLTTQKIKILKKWKKQLEISSFYTCVLKIMITDLKYDVRQMDWQMDRGMDRKSDIYRWVPHQQTVEVGQ